MALTTALSTGLMPSAANALPSSIAADVENGVGECLRSFLREIVADAVFARSVRVTARELRGRDWIRATRSDFVTKRPWLVKCCMAQARTAVMTHPSPALRGREG